jgi:hypothetical protein
VVLDNGGYGTERPMLDGPTLISVELQQGDVSDVLRHLTAALAKRIRPS